MPLFDIQRRFEEPSTYAGLAAVLSGLNMIIGSPWLSQAAAVAEAAGQATGQGWIGVALAALGAVAMARKDPGGPR